MGLETLHHQVEEKASGIQVNMVMELPLVPQGYCGHEGTVILP